MKKSLGLFVITSLVVLMGVIPSATAGDVLKLSASSQIHEAIGREILGVLKQSSGITVRSHVFSSPKCLDRLKNGVSDMAASTIQLSIADRESGLIEIPICRDSLVIIVNPECGVKDITLRQARRLFSGHIKNWKEIGGADLPILRIIPDQNTGAYRNFKRLVMGTFEPAGDLVATKSFTAVVGVKNIPGSIAFISNGIALQFRDINVLTIGGVSSSEPAYPFRQEFAMVIKGKPTPLIKEVIKFLTCDAAKNIMKKRGMEPILK